jgi:hypothetical protein
MPSIINSDDGVVSGTSGLKTTGGNDGITTFQQNGTEVARITAAGNVGIGTSSPGATLEVAGGAANGLARVGQLQFKNSSGNYSAGADGVHIFPFSDGMLYADNFDGGYVWRTGVSSTERARIDTSGNFLFNSGYGSVATAYGCRAWVNFNGTGTVAIRASGNVSSITDNGTGTYTVNITNAMPDADYSVVLGLNAAIDAAFIKLGKSSGIGVPTTSAFQVNTTNFSAVYTDYPGVFAAIFR